MDYGVEFDVAEVLEYDRTYNYIGSDKDNNNISELFALKVRLCSKYFNQKIVYAKPSNMNIKQIPMIGEFVLLYKTFNQESNAVLKRETWYYVTSIDVQSSMNENMLPGISEDLPQTAIDKIKPGKNFTRKSISPLQPLASGGGWAPPSRTRNRSVLPCPWSGPVGWPNSSKTASTYDELIAGP